MSELSDARPDIVVSFAAADDAQGMADLESQVADRGPALEEVARRVRELEELMRTTLGPDSAIQIRGLDTGWVSGFAFILQEFVEQILGRSVDIELCSETASRRDQTRAARSAVFLSVISPAYLEQRTLRGHIESFLSGSGGAGFPVPESERAFAVAKRPIGSAAALAGFDEDRVRELWTEDPSTGEPRELPSSLSDADELSEAEQRAEREFLKRTYGLAAEIAAVLRRLSPVEAVADADADRPRGGASVSGRTTVRTGASGALAEQARHQAEREVAPIAEDASRRIEERRLEPIPVPESSDAPGAVPAAGTGSEPARGSIGVPDAGSEAPEEDAGQAERAESGQGKRAESADATGPAMVDRLTIYVDYDERDIEATKVFEDYLGHYLEKKFGQNFTLLTPLLISEEERASLEECECCGRQTEAWRREELDAIDLGFLRRVRQAHVTLVLISRAPPSWVEGRLEKILQFDTDPRQTPEIHRVKPLARAVYVVLPEGEAREKDRKKLRRWHNPFQRDFKQLPEKPKESFDPKPLEEFFSAIDEGLGQRGPTEL